MASAYVGTLIMPPVFGYLAEFTSLTFLPIYLLIILIIMYVMHELLHKVKSTTTR